ncbi:hypothetical protein [Leucobacter sp.]
MSKPIDPAGSPLQLSESRSRERLNRRSTRSRIDSLAPSCEPDPSARP